jgi:nucleoside-diphosphate-sugar epimerase
MKIAIIGAAGGIGSVLADSLRENDKFSLLLIDDLSTGKLNNFISRKNKEALVQVDFLEIDDSLFSNVDVIILLCAVSSLAECQLKPELALKSNVFTTNKAIEIAKKFGTRIIFASSSAVYESNLEIPFKETHPIKPNLVYSNTKYFSEHLLESASLTNKIDVIAIRFFNVFGPRQNFERKNPPLVNYLVREIVNSRKPELFANVNQARDYVYVNDLIHLVKLILNESFEGYDVINACSGKGLTIGEILAVLERYFKERIDVEWGEPQYLWSNQKELFKGVKNLELSRVGSETLKTSIGDPAKAFLKFGWTASTKVTDAIYGELDFMVKNYKNYKN